ncbi:MAG: hypothetical protein IIX00_06180, partial [Tidjanibacter sp.]|nr:hypothetical protein [Tidjanibacter sp.]
VDEMGAQESFRGYGPEQGYDFLRIAVQNYYKKRNVDLNLEEIAISKGGNAAVGAHPCSRKNNQSLHRHKSIKKQR